MTTNTSVRNSALQALGVSSAVGYGLLLWMSKQFGGDVVVAERPTLWMLGVFVALFLQYWVALWLAVRVPPTRRLVMGIFAAALLFRALLLPSVPIHEIDIYRYLWDGAVLAEGVSPYRYSPQEVQAAVQVGGTDTDPALQRLVELQSRSQSLSESLHAIHFGQYPSPYPTVSQAVFALSAQVTPDTATRETRLVIMKALLVLFDLGTLVVVVLLLVEVGMHPGWSLAYGWCPLIMKEVANGGHLDSIAVFLTTLAIWMLVRSRRAVSSRGWSIATGGVLALAIGAKLYPVVLLPLFAGVWLRRRGWLAAASGMVSTGLVAGALLFPLFGPTKPEPAAQPEQIAVKTAGQLNVPSQAPQPPVEPDQGIRAFLTQWEMNDLLFMVVLENLRQQEDIEPERKPWFVFTSDAWSRRVGTRWIEFKDRFLKKNPAKPRTPAEYRAESFSLARLLTGTVFGLITCILAWTAAGKNDPCAWCRAAMLTLAWFWLTCPTQNPWYWCWVLPLLPFARYRTWYFVAALTMLYYLRFWLTAHFPLPPVLGTPYNGVYFFYFVVVWIEFVPLFAALFMEWWLVKKQVR